MISARQAKAHAKATDTAQVRQHRSLEGPLLPMLHAFQAAVGHVPTEAHAPICDALKTCKVELHGVVSGQHDVRSAPAAMVGDKVVGPINAAKLDKPLARHGQEVPPSLVKG